MRRRAHAERDPLSLFAEYPDVGPRGRAVIRYRRSPREVGPPFGYADLPGAVDAALVLAGGRDGKRTVVQGEILGGSRYSIERATRWDPNHPRDASAIAALRSLSGPWEIGWRAGIAERP